jgi:hypothetical protein
VIPWNDDPGVFVANALSPAQVLGVDIDEEHRIASVTVPERMLSLAIGREGQNARLAARLTGWRIDIRSDVSVAEAKAEAPTPEAGSVAVDEATGEAAAAVQPSEAEEVAEPAATPKRTRKVAAATATDPAASAPDAAVTPVTGADSSNGAEVPTKPKRTRKVAAQPGEVSS